MRLMKTVLALGLLLWVTAPSIVLAAHQAPAMFASNKPAQAATPTLLAPQPSALPPTADLSATSDAGATDTNGQFVAAVIIWAVIIILVAVTAFLVWRTRPRR